MTTEELYIAIQHLMEQGGSFAVYRLPGENRVRYIGQGSGPVSVYNDIRALNGQEGFVIAPFSIAAGHPVVVIRGEEKELPGVIPVVDGTMPTKEYTIGRVSEVYESRFRLFLDSLQQGVFTKLVLSRALTHRPFTTFSPVETFLRACTRYIRSYVYLCHTPETGTWLGATPEILLAGREGAWRTVALAGTQPLQQGELPTSWDGKNQEEQQLVAGYIRKRLSAMDIRVAEEGPYTVRAGELAHLRSDFHFSLSDTDHLGDLLAALHPTPAVCGVPKEEAYRFILDHEGYDRQYYSGFIGRLDPRGESDLYVNLRCMQIRQESLTLYAGGGILPSSLLEEEWKETEDKLQTMSRIIE